MVVNLMTEVYLNPHVDMFQIYTGESSETSAPPNCYENYTLV